MPIFVTSLSVTTRKRISEDELNKMTVKLLNKQLCTAYKDEYVKEPPFTGLP